MTKKKTSKENQKVEELTEDLKRLQAEFANYRRREGEAKAELIDLARQDVVRDLLPLLDNIDRALAHYPKHLQDDPWAMGVSQVAKQARETLGEMGVIRIESVGQPFDHNLHEAISLEEGEGSREVVAEELQAGYKMGDKVIRHAVVKVKKQ
ncbi:MAG TPA: nucleotide exchange factor GrpE [Candidatus Dormibacteraeota bacterium]|nr:nucleotide exchange factor GrpE [Candidatus Dormibacteraeota bacterium]